MWNKIKAAFGRLWRPRRRTGEHGFYDQRAASQHRSLQDIEQAGGRATGLGQRAERLPIACGCPAWIGAT